MRYYWLFMVLLIGIVVVCGCTQSSLAPVPPTPTTPATTAMPSPSLTVVVPAPKQINVSAWQTDRDVRVQFNGGRDAADLSMFKVQIDNHNGQIVKEPIYNPEIGKEYIFKYIGTPDADSINIIGVFRDGTEQTVLLTYV